MVRYEIVGLHSCPWFAKAIKLADAITAKYPGIEFHTEMLNKLHWHDYCEKMRRQRGWDIKGSPCIWEVLVEPSGKGILIGDCNDFCELASIYFDIFYDPSSAALSAMALENKAKYGESSGGQGDRDAPIFNIAILHAPLPLLLILLPALLSESNVVQSGILFNIHLYDESSDVKEMQGILMEVVDLAASALFKVSHRTSLPIAMYRAHLIIFAEDLSRTRGESGRDWISRVDLRVKDYVRALNDKGTKLEDARIIVGGEGPACYIAESLRAGVVAEAVGQGRIVASGQHISLRAKNEIGKIGKIPGGRLKHIHAWGWPGETGAFIELHDATLEGAEDSAKQGPCGGVETSLAEIAQNTGYIYTKFSKDFLKRQRIALKQGTGGGHMVLAESIMNTVKIWLRSEEIMRPEKILKDEELLLRQDGNSEMATGPENGWISIPVINAGVPLPASSTFPEGMFLVQPAICLDGRWQSLGLISRKAHKVVREEVNKLFAKREKLLHWDGKDPEDPTPTTLLLPVQAQPRQLVLDVYKAAAAAAAAQGKVKVEMMDFGYKYAPEEVFEEDKIFDEDGMQLGDYGIDYQEQPQVDAAAAAAAVDTEEQQIEDEKEIGDQDLEEQENKLEQDEEGEGEDDLPTDL